MSVLKNYAEGFSFVQLRFASRPRRLCCNCAVEFCGSQLQLQNWSRGGSDAVTAAARAQAPLETAAAGQAGAGKGAVVSRAGGSCHGSASLTCTTTVGLRRQGGGLVNRKYLSSPHASWLR